MKNKLIKKIIGPFQYLFWWTQLRILSACPPLFGLVTRFSLGAPNSPKVWIKTFLRMTVRVPHALFLHFRSQLAHRAVISRVVFPITTRCTLNCDKCVAHIPDLKGHHMDMPINDLLADIQSLLSCIDSIHFILLSGGETFLHPNLDEIIRACAASGKIRNIGVQSNGTVLPDAKTLAALREAKALVRISEYSPALQPEVGRMKALLKENGIRYTHESATAWSDTGEFCQLQGGSVKRRFSVCIQRLCYPCFNGKLHLCCKSVILMELGFIPDCKEDYIDLRKTSPAEFWGQWRKLLKRRSIAACSYCLGDTYESSKIPVAVQRK